MSNLGIVLFGIILLIALSNCEPSTSTRKYTAEELQQKYDQGFREGKEKGLEEGYWNGYRAFVKDGILPTLGGVTLLFLAIFYGSVLYVIFNKLLHRHKQRLIHAEEVSTEFAKLKRMAKATESEINLKWEHYKHLSIRQLNELRKQYAEKKLKLTNLHLKNEASKSYVYKLPVFMQLNKKMEDIEDSIINLEINLSRIFVHAKVNLTENILRNVVQNNLIPEDDKINILKKLNEGQLKEVLNDPKSSKLLRSEQTFIPIKKYR